SCIRAIILSSICCPPTFTDANLQNHFSRVQQKMRDTKSSARRGMCAPKTLSKKLKVAALLHKTTCACCVPVPALRHQHPDHTVLARGDEELTVAASADVQVRTRHFW